MPIRQASHAGSWYERDRNALSSQLATWLAQGREGIPDSKHCGSARAIIAPHAGYAYCGAVAGYAYGQIDPGKIQRVFILGPSHHVYINGIALSSCNVFRTPLGDLQLDEDIYQKLKSSSAAPFEMLTVEDDEAEHSLEMHMPFVAKVFEGHHIKIVPLVVGNITEDLERLYGEILLPFLLDPSNLFIISSDFCHWGRRFRYTPYDKSAGEIYHSIEQLDRKGMELIEGLDPALFRSYLAKTENTICGRNPIVILLSMLKSASGNGAQTHLTHERVSSFSLKFLNYAQSSQCRTMHDSSVSYAAAAVYSSRRASSVPRNVNHNNNCHRNDNL